MYKNKRFTTPFDRLTNTSNVGELLARILIVILLTYIGVVLSFIAGVI